MEALGSLFPLAIVFVLTGWAFNLGWGALKLSRQPALPAAVARSLRWMALNLCEPMVNVLLIGGMLIGRIDDTIGSGGPFSDWGDPALWGELAAVAWPLLVLAAPIAGIASRHALARRIALETAALGLLRAAVTVATFINPLLVVVGLALLVGCCLWGEKWLARLGELAARPADTGGGQPAAKPPAVTS